MGYHRLIRKKIHLLVLVVLIVVALLYGINVSKSFPSNPVNPMKFHFNCSSSDKTVVAVPTNTEPTPPKKLAWIIHFNYEPVPTAVEYLLHFYAKHFIFIAIVSPTGRIGLLHNIDTNCSNIEIVWSPACPNSLHEEVAGAMMRCYAMGLELLQTSTKFKEVDYVVMSNDDVVLNITKIKELANDGFPVSHLNDQHDGPPMFSPPPDNLTYFKGWKWRLWWPECQQVFSEVPQEYKDRFQERQGFNARFGRVDAFFLPVKTVPEFLFLSKLVAECWMEMSIPNALAMLSVPTLFYSTNPELLMYRGFVYGTTPESFEEDIKGKSFVSYHSYKLGYVYNQIEFPTLISKYRLN